MPVIGNKLFCTDPNCNHEQPQINFIKCQRCGADLGAPNVNEVSTDDEINALRERYVNAKDFIKTNGHETVLTEFEMFFQNNVQAVLNLDFVPLKNWMLHDDKYKNYYRLTDESVRNIATPENDRKRNIIDSFLFGSWKDIIFAALSLNNTGLLSYEIVLYR